MESQNSEVLLAFPEFLWKKKGQKLVEEMNVIISCPNNKKY